MDDQLSTRELAWVLGRSSGRIRDLIRSGEIDAARIVGGFRIPKAEVLRLARARIEAEAGRKVSGREVERVDDEVIATHEARTGRSRKDSPAHRRQERGG